MATIISAIIGATVASIVAFLTHWQWRRQQATAAAERYKTDRADALKELWEKVSDHSTTARMPHLSPEQFYRTIADLNFFLIRRSPFLDETEKQLARLYLEGIYSFRAEIDKSRNRAAYEALTTSRPTDEVGDLMGAIRSGDKIQELENLLSDHIGRVIAGQPSEIDITTLRNNLIFPQILPSEGVSVARDEIQEI